MESQCTSQNFKPSAQLGFGHDTKGDGGKRCQHGPGKGLQERI